MERVIWYQCAIILSLVGLSPVENFKSEIVMLQPLFASLLQAVMDNSTGDSLTKYPQSTMMMDPHTENKRAGNGRQSCIRSTLTVLPLAMKRTIPYIF